MAEPNKDAAPIAPAKSVSDGLVEVWKDGDKLRVHPTTLESHKKAGWKQKG